MLEDYNAALIAVAIAAVIISLIIMIPNKVAGNSVRNCEQKGGVALTANFGTDIKDCKFREGK